MNNHTNLSACPPEDLNRDPTPAVSKRPRQPIKKAPSSVPCHSNRTPACLIARKSRIPFRQLQLAGGGGWRDEKMLDVRAFLALRQLLTLAEGGVDRPAASNRRAGLR